jgi:hypothetical protein
MATYVNGTKVSGGGASYAIAVNGGFTSTTDPGPGGSPDILLKGDSGPSAEVGTGLVSTWTSQEGNSRTFTQATSGKQPTQVNPGNLGRQCISFDGTSDILVSSQAASAFRHLVDGTGFMYVGGLYLAGTGSNQLVWAAQSQGNVVLPFCLLRFDGTSERLIFNIYNGSGNTVFAVSSNGSVPRNNKYVVSCGYKEGVAQEYFLRLNGVQLMGGVSAAVPAGAGVDPSGTLALSSTFNGTTNYFGGQVDTHTWWKSYDLTAVLPAAESWARTRIGV